MRDEGDRSDRARIHHAGDDRDFLGVASKVLEQEDGRFSVDTTTSGDAALDRLADAAYGCVVSDFDVPGIDFLEVVRADNPYLPFIRYTGKGSEEVASEAISAGLTDHLQTTADAGQHTVLANRISNVVERYRSERALARQNEERRQYERMVNSIQEAAFIFDADGRFVVGNDYLAEWYDGEPESLVGQESRLIPRIREAADGDPHGELLAGERDELEGHIDGECPGHDGLGPGRERRSGDHPLGLG